MGILPGFANCSNVDAHLGGLKTNNTRICKTVSKYIFNDAVTTKSLQKHTAQIQLNRTCRRILALKYSEYQGN